VVEKLFPQPGDRVLVPWGLEEVLGEVVEVYPTGLGDHAVVRLLGSGDLEATVTIPADSLRRAEGISSGMSPRLDAIAYERNVISAINHLITNTGLVLRDADPRDSGADAILTDGRGQLAIQAKFVSSGRVSSDIILVAAGYASAVRPLILVTNGDLSSGASEQLQHIRRRKIPTWYVRWNSQSDNTELFNVIWSGLKGIHAI
jgi:hypothetical protein